MSPPRDASGLTKTLRWAWFIALIAAAFAYLTAGLSPLGETFSLHPFAAIEADATAVKGDDTDEFEGGDAEREDRRLLGSSGAPLPAGENRVPAGENRVPAGNDTGWSEWGDAGLGEAIATVDQAWADDLAERGLRPAERADWLQVCRRLSLALVGSGMSLEEIRELEALPEADRERRHLENLLRDPRFHDYWAERWTRRLVGADEGPFLVYRQRRFRVWLRERFAENERYDRIVRRLINAKGLWTDRPEVNFWTVTFDSGDGQPDPERLAARSARVFLGLRIDCLQCHDDFLGNVSLGSVDDPRPGLQSDFHQFAAFFSAARFDGLQGIRGRDVDYKTQYLGSDEEVSVEAAVPYQPELLPDRGSPRAKLARWMTHPENRQAARAAVSQIAALMFGRPIGHGVDDLPLGMPGPVLLDRLADRLIEDGYDLRQLIRTIAGSAPFRVSSVAEFPIDGKHEAAFAVFPLSRLRPEQVAGCIVQASRVKRLDHDSAFILQLQKLGATGDFVRRFGDLGEDEYVTDGVTVSQRLVMLNGALIDESTEWNPILNASSHLAMFARDDAHAVELAYLSVLNRYPTERERTHFTSRLSEAERRNEALEDLFWVLMNSSEFAWNH